MASAQKCGGVQRKITANSTTAGQATVPVTAAQPTSTGKQPAAPPITMFDGRPPLEPERVDEDVEQRWRRRPGPRPASWRRRPEHQGGGRAEGDARRQRLAGLAPPRGRRPWPPAAGARSASSPRRCRGRCSSSGCSRCRPPARRRAASPPAAAADGSPRWASSMVGTVVTSSSSMIRGLVSRNSDLQHEPDRPPPGRRGESAPTAGLASQHVPGSALVAWPSLAGPSGLPSSAGLHAVRVGRRRQPSGPAARRALPSRQLEQYPARHPPLPPSAAPRGLGPSESRTRPPAACDSRHRRPRPGQAAGDGRAAPRPGPAPPAQPARPAAPESAVRPANSRYKATATTTKTAIGHGERQVVAVRRVVRRHRRDRRQPGHCGRPRHHGLLASIICASSPTRPGRA